MAFNGSLSEFGVVALLQLPGTNHLSGRLILKQAESTAEFYYKKGKLFHATLGEISGKEALVEVIDWIEGDFAFDSSSSTDETTIHQDIQNTLMWALKERDEKKKLKDEEEQAARELVAQEMAEEPVTQEPAEASSLPEPVVLPLSLMQNSSSILTAYLINSKGRIVARAEANDDFTEKVSPLLTAVQSFIRAYPERAVGKTFIEDSEFTLALSGLSSSLTAVIVVSAGVRLGVLSIELGKFVRALLASELEILNER